MLVNKNTSIDWKFFEQLVFQVICNYKIIHHSYIIRNRRVRTFRGIRFTMVHPSRDTVYIDQSMREPPILSSGTSQIQILITIQTAHPFCQIILGQFSNYTRYLF